MQRRSRACAALRQLTSAVSVNLLRRPAGDYCVIARFWKVAWLMGRPESGVLFEVIARPTFTFAARPLIVTWLLGSVPPCQFVPSVEYWAVMVSPLRVRRSQTGGTRCSGAM